MVDCPANGETDAWVPIEESLAVWRRAARDAELTVARLTGCDHATTLDEREDLAGVSAQYEAVLLDWLGRRLAAPESPRR
ncbi:hypothetical protein O7602_14450 [Micromonospora sp. WMMD1128]|uniref:hypothetical protein n=1 Tax=Micromonospora sp. WMMD1128 TaxID=3015150 RepID=UPI00248BDDDC|nr:hypothetical protein [Micromonospora sp. WMMD1128]WBB76657.1 hypothetical protein O7602_14450 [Micromonospora sp. WMMD1128]